MSDLTEFEAWPKIPRLNKNICLTEKIDGTNGAIVIRKIFDDLDLLPHETSTWLTSFDPDERNAVFAVSAQSRNKWVMPGKQSDNAGFAAWVWDNATTLVQDLGVGRRFGEWWGQGIQRGYGLDHKVFSLFDPRWSAETFTTPNLDVVPTLLNWGEFDSMQIDMQVYRLESEGSVAAPGWMTPEGIIVRHSASGQLYKRLIENDKGHKG